MHARLHQGPNLLSLPVDILLSLDLELRDTAILSRVCKYLNEIFRPLVFRNVQLDGSLYSTPANRRKLRSFLYSIHLNPSNIRHVRKLTVSAQTRGSYGDVSSYNITSDLSTLPALFDALDDREIGAEIASILKAVSVSQSVYELALSIPSGRKDFLHVEFVSTLTDVHLENRNDGIAATRIAISETWPLFQLPRLERLNLLNFSQTDCLERLARDERRCHGAASQLHFLGLYNCDISPQALQSILNLIISLKSLTIHRWVQPGYKKKVAAPGACASWCCRLTDLPSSLSNLNSLTVLEEEISPCSCLEKFLRLLSERASLEQLTISPGWLFRRLEPDGKLDDVAGPVDGPEVEGETGKYGQGHNAITQFRSIRRLNLVQVEQTSLKGTLQYLERIGEMLKELYQRADVHNVLDVNVQGLRFREIDDVNGRPNIYLADVQRSNSTLVKVVGSCNEFYQYCYSGPSLVLGRLDQEGWASRYDLPAFFKQSLLQQNMMPSTLMRL